MTTSEKKGLWTLHISTSNRVVRRRRRHHRRCRQKNKFIKMKFRHAWFRFLKILIFLQIMITYRSFPSHIKFLSCFTKGGYFQNRSITSLWHIVNLTYHYKLWTFFVNLSFTYCFMSSELEVMNGSLLTQLRTRYDNIFDLFFFANIGWVFLDCQDDHQKKKYQAWWINFN